MRTFLCLALVAVGCAHTPVVKLHVSESQANRVDAAQRQAAAAAVETARKALAAAEAEVPKAQAEHTHLMLDDKTPSPELDAVKRAVEDRKTTMVAWRRAQVEVARWHLAVAEAQRELMLAEAVSRTGADLDPERFRAQSASMQSGRSDAARTAAGARAQLDEKERALTAAKDRYAATIKAPAASR
jgi:hypothetical protein